MRFSIITLFPEAFDSYFSSSILNRARSKKLITVSVVDIRRFTRDRHKTADDRPYGGGPGMVLKVEPILWAVEDTRKKSRIPKKNTLIIVTAASGRQFSNVLARRYVKKFKHIIIIAGHYEGMDERIAKILQATSYKLQAISIGPYILTGGELPAMVIIDAISRHIPGVLGKSESIEEARGQKGVPVYTRPETVRWKGKDYLVPKVLFSGDHAKIERWRKRFQRTLKDSR